MINEQNKENSLNNIPNQIDLEFKSLIDYIKSKNLDEIKEVIKHNFEYFRKSNYSYFKSITDYYNKYKLWGTIDLDIGDDGVIENNAKALVEHREDFEWLYERLGDYRSKRILVNVLYYWLMLDAKRISQLVDNQFMQYFDLDLIKCDKDEVFVDIGSYIGDTVINYTKVFGKDSYKRMYCYDIVPSNVDFIKKNVEIFNLDNIIIRPKGVSNKKGVLYLPNNDTSSIAKLDIDGDIEVKTVTIDDDVKEKVTFIKMDIEGAEEEALLGCLKKIEKDQPKLALSVYHNNRHLWKLPRIIDEANPNYKFYLRYYGGPILPTEYILYAI